MKGMSVLRRVTGIGAAGSVALALLGGGCIFAATAGPRQAQATGTRALQQTVNGLSPLDKTIVVSTDLAAMTSAFNIANAATGTELYLTPDALTGVSTQLRHDFSTGPLRMAPQPTDWAGLTTNPYALASTLPALKAIRAELEVAYRDPVAGHLRLVAGSMPATSPPSATNLQVVVTAQTARVFGLRSGAKVPISVPVPIAPGHFSLLKLDITGIVEPTDPGSAFWRTDPLLRGPALGYQPDGSAIWTGAVIADPGETGMIQSVFGSAGIEVQWVLPVSTATVHGPAQALFSQVNQITNQAPELTGLLAPIANRLTVSSGLVQPLAAFVQSSAAVNALLWMVYVGLVVASVVMLLLATRMLAARRSAELAMYQARGASLAQLFRLGAGGAAVACVPAAALAWAAAVLLVPDPAAAGPAAWWPPIATLAVITAAPGVVAAWQHRPPRRRRPPTRRRRRSWATRAVFEVTACAAAIGALIVSRAEAGTGDLYTSAAPVLVAVPAVIVVLRLYQLLLRGLARASARQRGVSRFLGLTRAAQATLAVKLPAMTLVLAVTVAAFTGMVRDAVIRGEAAVSWQETGADAVVTAPFSPDTLSSVISPAAVRAITTVPGVQHAATALVIPLYIGSGKVVTAIAVNPASYAALVASTQGFSPVDPVLLTGPPGQGAIPVLASPQAAAVLGGQGGSTIVAQQGLSTLRVRVAGELRSTPAMPAGGAFMVLPLSAIRGISAPQPVNLMLLTGSSIDLTRLRAAVRATAPASSAPSVTSRSLALRELTGTPLQQGTFVLFALAIGYAAALALAVMLLELALGAADREITMARLTTMGLAARQRPLLAAFELVPAITASAVAAIACAITLPRLVAPAINLSAFTQSQAPVPLRPDPASFLLPLAGLLAITAIALAYEIRSGRRRGPARLLRAA
jgi:putative ABC transport system permease protein